MTDNEKLLWTLGIAGGGYYLYQRRERAALGMYGDYGASRASEAARGARAVHAAASAAGVLQSCTYQYITRNRQLRAIRYRSPMENKRKRTVQRLKIERKYYRSAYNLYKAKADEVITAVDEARGDADKMVKSLKTGKGGGEDMKLAHYLIYELGDGEGDGILLNKIGKFITPRLRAQVKSAVDQYYATTSAMDDVLDPIKSVKSGLRSVVVCADAALDKLAWASTRPMELIWGYCTEADGPAKDYINDRRQFFKNAGSAGGPEYGPADRLTTKRRKWNQVCDEWREWKGGEVETTYEWPRFGARSWEDRPSGYKTAAHKIWRRGCVVGEHCGYIGKWEVRSCIYTAERVSHDVDALVADDQNYVNTLFAEADRLLVQLGQIAVTVRRILKDLITIISSPGFKRALHLAKAALIAGGIGLALTGPVGGVFGVSLIAATLVGGMKAKDVISSLLTSFKTTRSAMKTLRSELSGARTDLGKAKVKWNKTPWRRKVRGYMSDGRAMAVKLHKPWQWMGSQSVCTTVYPKITDSCMEKAIVRSEPGLSVDCPVPMISWEPKETLPRDVLIWGGPGGRTLLDAARTTALETEGETGGRRDDDEMSFNGYGALERQRFQMTRTHWMLLLGAGALYFYSQRDR